MKKIIVDIDFTISKKVDNYEDAIPNKRMIEKLGKYREKGFYIVLYSARNMKTFGGDVSMILEHTQPILVKWLDENVVPYDEIVLGKPWNDEGFYIDDNAIRPLEFLSKSEQEIKKMLNSEREELWK